MICETHTHTRMYTSTLPLLPYIPNLFLLPASIQHSQVIIYAKQGCTFTPRNWFLFNALGHDLTKLHLMAGSLEDWTDAGGPIDNDPVSVPTAKVILERQETPSYVSRDPPNVVDMAHMLKSINREDVILIDPRGPGGFGQGHIPGSINIPFSKLVQENDKLQLRPATELAAIFEEAGVDPLTDKTLIATCGSGVSVCHVMLALSECGRTAAEKPTFMYDGSWAEWGTDPDTPKDSTTES